MENPGGGGAGYVRVSDIQASWAISETGTFSCFARVDDLRRAGFGFDLQDRWITWTGPAGTWGGVCIGRPVEDGIVEIEGEGWASLLRDRMLVEFERVPAGGAGGLAARAVRGASSAEPTFISIGYVDEGGEMIPATFGGQDVLDDVLSELSGDVEWIVDENRVFHAMRRLGRDLSHTIRLIEGRQIVHYLIADDSWAEPSDESYAFETIEETARRALAAGASIIQMDPQLSLVASAPVAAATPASGGDHNNKRHRRRRQRRDGPDGPGGRRNKHNRRNRHRGRGGGGRSATMPPPPPPWVARPVGTGANSPAVPAEATMDLPTVPIQLTLANVNGIYRFMDLGNTIRVELSSSGGFAGRVRIMSKGYDSNTGDLEIAGEALPDEW